MNRVRHFLFAMSIAGLVVACNMDGSLSTPGSEVGTTVSATLQPPSEQPATSISPAATATTGADAPGTAKILEGPEIKYRGIRFSLDPALGSQVYVYDDVLTLDGSTAHSTRFALAPEEYCTTWCLEIFPVTEFEQAFGSFVFPPAGYRGGAAVVFKAQEKALSTPNGSGERAIEAFGQDHYAVSNASLKYVFRGYSTDRQYALFVQVSINARALPDAVPTMSSSGDPIQEILDYNARAADSMNALAPADFAPNLDLLDALVASVQVNPD